jgi:HSP20 family protein
MTLIKFEPLQEFETMHDKIQRYFDDFPAFGFKYSDSFSPKIDISEGEKNIKVVAEIPGVSKEDIKIVIQDNILSIEGEKKKEDVKEDKNYYRAERSYGSFKRCFTLPVEVDSDNIEAKFENGVLDIEMKKLEPKKASEKVIELK